MGSRNHAPGPGARRRSLLACLVTGTVLLTSAVAGDLDEALARARTENGFLALVLLSSDAREEVWVKEHLQRPEWSEALAPHAHLVARASEHPSLAARLDAKAFPQFLLLDGEGREVGRLEGMHSLADLTRSFSRMIEAAERCRDRGGADAKPLDVESLFWAGSYSWNRGDRLFAIECFEKVRETAVKEGLERRISAEASRLIAQHHLDCGRYAQAEEGFKEVLRHDGREEWAGPLALGLALSLRRQGRIEEAVLAIERHIEGRSGSQPGRELLFMLGYLQHERGERAAARKLFATCAARFPGTVHGERARRYLEDGSVPATGLPQDAGSARTDPGARR